MKGLEELLDPVPEDQELQESQILADWLPKGYLSVSQINLYLNCPYQYYLRYIENKKVKASIRMLEGVQIHKGVEITLHEKIRTGKNPELDLMLDTFSEEFEQSKKLVDDWEDSSETKSKDQGILLCKTWHKFALPSQTPLEVERPFMTKVGEGEEAVPIVGRIDSVGWVLADPRKEYDTSKLDTVPRADRKVQDLKVTGRKWSEFDLRNSLQFATYSFVTGVQEAEVNMVIKSKAKKTQPIPKYESLTTKMEAGTVKHCLNVIQDVGKAIATGNFPRCPPDNPLCSEKFCGVWSYCRGKKE